MKKGQDGTELLLKSIAKGIFEKKGKDVLKIDLRKLDNRISDYFIICHGSSVSQVDAICDAVEDTVIRDTGERPSHVEGLENCFWVLLDYGDILVHIFQQPYRDFYDLESLWADGRVTYLEDNAEKKG